MKKKPHKPSERKKSGLRLTVAGWGLSKDGKLTVVEPHELPLKGRTNRRKAG